MQNATTITVIKYWKLIINDGVTKLSISRSELTKEILFHLYAQSRCISVAIPPGNEDVRRCIRTIDTPQYVLANTPLYNYNKSYINSEICGRYRVPIIVALQHDRNKTITRFNRFAFFMNSACLASSSYKCSKGSDVSIADIKNRHTYDKYSLSV